MDLFKSFLGPFGGHEPSPLLIIPQVDPAGKGEKGKDQSPTDQKICPNDSRDAPVRSVPMASACRDSSRESQRQCFSMDSICPNCSRRASSEMSSGFGICAIRKSISSSFDP